MMSYMVVLPHRKRIRLMSANIALPPSLKVRAQIDTNATANSMPENAVKDTLVGITACSSDPAGGTVTYSLLENAGVRFAIDSATGIVTVANGGLLNYESATSHSI